MIGMAAILLASTNGNLPKRPKSANAADGSANGKNHQIRSNKDGSAAVGSATTAAPSAVKLHNCYFTWSTPGFGRYGNQMVMMFVAYQLATITGCKMVPAPLKPQLKESLEFYKVYDGSMFDNLAAYVAAPEECSSSQEIIHRYPVMSVAEALAVMKPPKPGADGPAYYNVNEGDIWDWGIGYWDVGIFVQEPWLSAFAANFDRLHSSLQTIKEDFLRRDNFAISRSIGVHLRGEDFAQECTKLVKYTLPSTWLYACFVQFETVVKAIEARRSPDQPVFLSTNFESDAPILTNLKNFYGDLIIRPMELPPAYASLSPVFDNECLRHCKYFIGNAHSTFSQFAAARRHFTNYEYFLVFVPILGIRYPNLLWCIYLAAFAAYYRKTFLSIKSWNRSVVNFIGSRITLLVLLPFSLLHGFYIPAWMIVNGRRAFQYAYWDRTAFYIYFVTLPIVLALLCGGGILLGCYLRRRRARGEAKAGQASVIFQHIPGTDDALSPCDSDDLQGSTDDAGQPHVLPIFTPSGEAATSGRDTACHLRVFERMDGDMV